jgi:hypothetical protein
MFKPLADELSECGESLFRSYMRCCEDLINHIKSKAPCFVSSGILNDDSTASGEDAVPTLNLTQPDENSPEDEPTLETPTAYVHQPVVLQTPDKGQWDENTADDYDVIDCTNRLSSDDVLTTFRLMNRQLDTLLEASTCGAALMQTDKMFYYLQRRFASKPSVKLWQMFRVLAYQTV